MNGVVCKFFFKDGTILRIISNKDKLKNASDRDHSLEFMVAAGLLFKEVNSKTYEDNFSGLKQIEFFY